MALLLWLMPWAASAQPENSAKVSIEGYPQREVVAIRYLPMDSDFVPSVWREGDQSIRINAPRAAWGELEKAQITEPGGLDLLAGIRTNRQSLILETRTDAFGYISQFDPDSLELLVTLFPDPLGNRWPSQPASEVVLTPGDPDQDSQEPAGLDPVADPVFDPEADPEADLEGDPETDPGEGRQATDLAEDGIAQRAENNLAQDTDADADQPIQPSADTQNQNIQRRTITPRTRAAPSAPSTPHTQKGEDSTDTRAPINVQDTGQTSIAGNANTLRASIRRVGPEQGEQDDMARSGEPEARPIPDPQAVPDQPPDPDLELERQEPIPQKGDEGDAQPRSQIRNQIRPLSPEQAGNQEQAQQPEQPQEQPQEQAQEQAIESEQLPDDARQQTGSRQRAAIRRQIDTAAPAAARDVSNATDETTDRADGITGNATARAPLDAQEVEDDERAEAEPDETEQARLSEESGGGEETGRTEEKTPAYEKYKKLLTTAQAAMMNSEYGAAAEALDVLTTHSDVPDEILEEALFDLGDTLFALHQNDLQDNFEPIASAYERAMNLNPKSRRAALAMRNLGVLHLKVNNLPEARAFFNVLRQEYPYDPLVPTTDYYLGEYFFERGDFNQAADYFQAVVEDHPEHAIAQQATIGLVKSLNTLGFDEQAAQIMHFLESRWPRYYVEDPSLLELAGIIALRVNQLESAKQRMLTYYNLQPDTEDADMLLARIGDIYLLTGKPESARHVFEKTAREYPDEEGGLIAKMRLVEGGIHDDPSLEDMFYTMRAAEVYSEIISKHPDSPLAAVARLKLAIWQIWNKRLEDSLMVVSDFLEDYPDHSLAPKAREVGLEAFSQLVTRNVEDGRFAEILEQWDQNPFLSTLLDEMSIETQLGLALAFWKEGDFDQALELANPYLNEETPRQALLPALELVLGVYLEQQLWDRIIELGELREEIDLPEKQDRELTYALALAEEKLGHAKRAQPLWLGLAEDLKLSEAQRGYALYYLARTAMEDKDWEKVYLYAQEALSLLLLDREDPGKIKDAMSWLTTVTERTGRLQESLAWAMELEQRMDESDPEWAMSRYRLAQLHQRMNNQEQWREVLEDLQEKDPDGLYGRLAGSALEGRSLEDNANRFSR